MSLQQILSYSSAIERIQQVQQQHPDTYQQFSSFKMKEENATKQGEVPDPKHAEYVSIREDKDSQPKGFELGQNSNFIYSGMKTIAHGNIDQSIFPCERHRRFCPVTC